LLSELQPSTTTEVMRARTDGWHSPGSNDVLEERHEAGRQL
jgi:hypothetical protein